MKMNLPVTHTEFVVEKGNSIVSKTDLQGNITYVNPYFIEASGFEEHELIGAPQNIIRHPDMPSEAFKDLWETVQKGFPWTGLVKNRRKDGGFYWVLATVTPIKEKGKIVGYMSVRIKPDPLQVKKTTQVYDEMRSGQAKGKYFQQGVIYQKGIKGLFEQLKYLQLKTKIQLFLGALAVIQLVSAVMSYQKVNGQEIFDVTLLALLFNISLWYLLIVKVFRPLSEATNIAHAVTGGDLTVHHVEIRRRDELGTLIQSLHQMSLNLTGIIRDVRTNIVTISEATSQIAQGNRDLSNRAAEESLSVDQTAVNMTHLTQSVKDNAERVIQANTIAHHASFAAEKGKQVASDAGFTMQEISHASKKIEDIVGLIDNIAFQTNILALNAAVEAARAGEQGRGFAVVATEVRTLAQHSAHAAKEIKGLIENSVQRIDEGSQLMLNVTESMRDIVSSVSQVSALMNQVSEANHKQNIDISNTHQSIQKIDGFTQKNTQLALNVTFTADHLDYQTNKLEQAMSTFKF